MAKQKTSLTGRDEWNREFDELKRRIGRKADKTHLTALRRAGANEELLLELLTMSVHDTGGASRLMRRSRENLASLVDQLVTVTNFAERVANDPKCDGRFWLALLCELPWNQVPKPGRLEAATLKRMRDFAEMFRGRAAAMGAMSRTVTRINGTMGRRRLLMSVHSITNKNFDREIAWLLSDAYEAAGRHERFSAEQIKKFRQRHLPETCGRGTASAPNGVDPSPKRKTFGQRIAEV